jgi:hypothetical protein
MREKPTAEDRKEGRIEVGEMWYATWLSERMEDGTALGAGYLSTRYLAERWEHRPPLIVRLPGGIDFCIDSRADCPGGEVGWQVSGEPPNITVSPSINVMGVYHGYLRNGEITDDVEGRTHG